MTEWTDAQKRVIQSNAHELICTAAAGSGKTAAMIERIVEATTGSKLKFDTLLHCNLHS